MTLGAGICSLIKTARGNLGKTPTGKSTEDVHPSAVHTASAVVQVQLLEVEVALEVVRIARTKPLSGVATEMKPIDGNLTAAWLL